MLKNSNLLLIYHKTNHSFTMHFMILKCLNKNNLIHALILQQGFSQLIHSVNYIWHNMVHNVWNKMIQCWNALSDQSKYWSESWTPGPPALWVGTDDTPLYQEKRTLFLDCLHRSLTSLMNSGRIHRAVRSVWNEEITPRSNTVTLIFLIKFNSQQFVSHLQQCC